MRIVCNGKAREVADGLTLGALVDSLGQGREGVAAAVNSAIVRRADWDATALRDGDEVEVFSMVAGG
ncbi:MAG: sulfur carrier protein ThiS [Succinivibrionaceae bacterium]|nr:sulfur carrier protein ThiS [Succinivibrionaceae bacterium]